MGVPSHDSTDECESGELHEGSTGQVCFFVGMCGMPTGWPHCTKSVSQNGSYFGLCQAVKSASSLGFT